MGCFGYTKLVPDLMLGMGVDGVLDWTVERVGEFVQVK